MGPLVQPSQQNPVFDICGARNLTESQVIFTTDGIRVDPIGVIIDKREVFQEGHPQDFGYC